ncbi:aKG-HExxH-type peptide beta-hydroxylase [Vibrio alginolyticus]|uniref:aKG-HExxH-type peptide beta-hydroxylase n=1 Tax=Vibrio alginolyticus TaxID=663 RepID=UPI00215C5746|nr:HEXXH motif-containing putative peptide modification protein [Vibrio alginolyticus]MCR9586728.1 HEXXH motif-containing putative peptide modification protein [Vibrio alginolyticus]MCS0270225.1 HEXXH motif-containing putative peptide modification protein [Vibrio alginolyticus]
MEFYHYPTICQAEKLKKFKSESIHNSLRYVLYVCEGILDKETINKVNLFIEESERIDHSSGFLFYLVREIGKNIELENIENIKKCFNLIINLDIYSKKKVILGNKESIGVELFDFYSKINDDVYTFTYLPISEDKCSELNKKITSSLEYIRNIDGVLYNEILTIVDEFFIFKSLKHLDSEVVYSGSDFHKLGTVFINEETCDEEKYFIVDKIIHESAHQVLLSIMIQDEIVLNPDSERYPSPLRTGFRTMNGIYHAAFVLYRIAAFFYKVYLLDDSDSNALSYLNKNISQFDDCYSVIKKSGKLTDLGNKLISDCKTDIEEFKRGIY